MASTTDQTPELTLVVPVFNNADTLVELHHAVERVMASEQISYELLFVDDVGRDDSSHILLQLLAGYPRITVVAMHRNVGQHAAILHGLRFARGRWCLVMDADLQDPVEAIPLLMRHRKECKAVFAGRAGSYQSLPRMISSRCYKWLLHRLVGLPRDAGVFVLMDRTLVDALLAMPVRVPWINVMIGLSGLPACSIPVKRNKRSSGMSAYSTWGRLKSAMRGLYCTLSYRYWPLHTSYLESSPTDAVAWIRSSRH